MYRIMIVEDDLAMAGVMKKQIESWGNQVMCVSDFQNILPAFVEYDPQSRGLFICSAIVSGESFLEDPGNILRRYTDAGILNLQNLLPGHPDGNPTSRVYFTALDNSCSITKSSHFSSVSTLTCVGS